MLVQFKIESLLHKKLSRTRKKTPLKSIIINFTIVKNYKKDKNVAYLNFLTVYKEERKPGKRYFFRIQGN